MKNLNAKQKQAVHIRTCSKATMIFVTTRLHKPFDLVAASLLAICNFLIVWAQRSLQFRKLRW